jgi:hypothetical protein
MQKQRHLQLLRLPARRSPHGCTAVLLPVLLLLELTPLSPLSTPILRKMRPPMLAC